MRIFRFLLWTVIAILTLAVGRVAARLIHTSVIAPVIQSGPLTAAVDSGDTVRLFLLGDTGTGNEKQLAVASAMEERCREHGVEAIVLLGDNVYPVGVDSVNDAQWQEKVFDPYGGSCLESVPIYAVLGNHDYRGDPSKQIEATNHYERWNMPARFYQRTFGDVLTLVAIDTEFIDFCFKPESCVIDFLQFSLRADSDRWRVVVAHRPIETANPGKRVSTRGWILSKIVCDKADFYISGHSHHLEHRKAEGCDAALFVSGGGGNERYRIDRSDREVKFARSQWGFLELEATDELVVSRFFRHDGKELYATETFKPVLVM